MVIRILNEVITQGKILLPAITLSQLIFKENGWRSFWRILSLEDTLGQNSG